MATQNPQKRLIIRWATLKGVAAIILFLVIASFVEYIVVLYATNLGVKDETQLQWIFVFPLGGWAFAVVVSPLFHLVPLAVVISLAFSWIYLTKHTAVKPIETSRWKAEAAKRGRDQKLKVVRDFFGRIKSGVLKIRGVSYVWQKIHFARAAIKSALTVLLAFLAFIVGISLLTYPQLIYQTITGAYINNPSLFSFIKGTAQFFAPIGGFFSVINNALLAAAPGFRDFILTIGSVVKPLWDLDMAAKYLVFQNVAAWVSALAVLFYGQYKRKGFRYRRARRG